MKVVLIGGNPKGHDIPFHPSTKSGRKLRHIIAKTGLSCELDDMTKNSNDIPTFDEINDLKERYEEYQVVFLGRFVENALRDTFPNGIYLPHPASRRVTDLIRLTKGLADLTNHSATEKSK